MNINEYIDHTILKADAIDSDVAKLCDEARTYNFASVCVNPVHASFVSEKLKGSPVKTCCVIGFPLGAASTATKVFEAEDAIRNGADEIDMVINVGWLKGARHKDVQDEIGAIKKACGERILKVIIETCYLTGEEKVTACELSVAAGADYVKTSTGFGSGGATLEDVKLMKDAVKGKALIKASGGVRTLESALSYIDAGVSRIGTSSGIAIVEGSRK